MQNNEDPAKPSNVAQAMKHMQDAAKLIALDLAERAQKGDLFYAPVSAGVISGLDDLSRRASEIGSGKRDDGHRAC